MTIYVDLLFLLNLIINYLLLAGSAVLSGAPLKRLRLATGAALGALYSVFVFFPNIGFLAWTGTRILTGAALTAVAIPVKSARMYFKALLYFYISLLIFGGGMYLFYAFTAAGAQMVYSNGVYYVDMPLWLLLALSFAFYGLIRLIAFLQNRRASGARFEDVEICILGKYRVLRGFLDTGNALQDPLTLYPVLIVHADALRGILPQSMLDAVRQERFESLETLREHYGKLKCRFIPYRGIGGESRLIFAVRPDWVRRYPDGKPVENVVLGLVASPLSEDGSFEMLLHGCVALEGK